MENVGCHDLICHDMPCLSILRQQHGPGPFFVLSAFSSTPPSDFDPLFDTATFQNDPILADMHLQQANAFILKMCRI